MAGRVELAAVVVGPDDPGGVVPAQPPPGAALVVGARERAVELAVAQGVVVPAGDAAQDHAVDFDGLAPDRARAGAGARRRDLALVAGAARRLAGPRPEIVVAGDEDEVRRGGAQRRQRRLQRRQVRRDVAGDDEHVGRDGAHPLGHQRHDLGMVLDVQIAGQGQAHRTNLMQDGPAAPCIRQRRGYPMHRMLALGVTLLVSVAATPPPPAVHADEPLASTYDEAVVRHPRGRRVRRRAARRSSCRRRRPSSTARARSSPT